MGESTRRFDETRLGGGRVFFFRDETASIGTQEAEFTRWYKLTQTSGVALQSPSAFHCITLFLFSTWGLPRWSTPAEGVLRPAPSESAVGGKPEEKVTEAMMCTPFHMSAFLFREKHKKLKMFIYMIVIILIGIF